MGSARPRPLGVSDAVERLLAPGGAEAFSPLTGEPVLVVDLAAGASSLSERVVQEARVALAELACPSLAFGAARPSRATEKLVDRFDVLVEREAELEPVLAAAERTPLACLALVQLLRHSEGSSVHAGLFAESLVYSTLQAGPEFAAWRAARQPPPKGSANPEPAVLVDRDGDELQLVLNRPAKRNAFSSEMRDALVEGLEVARCDPSLSRVVLRGAGPAFCAGGDLDEFGTRPDPATAHTVRTTRSPARLLAACADRVRAEVHGACVGAGAELPAFAHRVIASRDAFFALPEVALGLVPGAGGSVSLPRRIGRQRTAWLALSGERLDAETALAWGLVDELSG